MNMRHVNLRDHKNFVVQFATNLQQQTHSHTHTETHTYTGTHTDSLTHSPFTHRGSNVISFKLQFFTLFCLHNFVAYFAGRARRPREASKTNLARLVSLCGCVCVCCRAYVLPTFLVCVTYPSLPSSSRPLQSIRSASSPLSCTAHTQPEALHSAFQLLVLPQATVKCCTHTQTKVKTYACLCYKLSTFCRQISA